MFRPAKTQKITERLFAARTLMVNFYLYNTGHGYAAFDTGLSPLFASLALKRLGIDPALVRAVFLTHSDFDHKSGMSLFENATIYLPAGEAPLVNKKIARRFIVYNGPVKNHVPLADGETLTLGTTTIKTVAAPGHTPGSACYLIGREAVATGDLLQITGAGSITQFSALQNMDHAGNLASLKRLYSEGLFANGRTILTGHSGFTVASPAAFSGL